MKKIKFSGKVQIIKTKKYNNTIDIDIIFTCDYKKEDMVDLRLLTQFLNNSSKEYKEEGLFKKELLRRLIIGYKASPKITGNKLFYRFNLCIPNPKKVKNFNIDEAFKMFYNNIYFPNIEKEEFSIDTFNREKEYIKKNIMYYTKDVKEYSYQEFLNHFDDDGYLKNNLYHNIDLIEKSTPNSVYKLYKKIISSPSLKIAYGNVDEEEINNLFNNYFKDYESGCFNKDYYCFLKTKNKPIYIHDKSKFKESALYIGYKVENMKEKDIIYLELLHDLISMNDLIYNELRFKNNLVYSSSEYIYSSNGALVIEAYTNSSSKDKAINIITKKIDELNNSNYIEKLKERVIKKLEYISLTEEDFKYAALSNIINKHLELDITIKERIEKYNKIEPKDIVNFIKRIKLDTVYFLEGEEDE